MRPDNMPRPFAPEYSGPSRVEILKEILNEYPEPNYTLERAALTAAIAALETQAKFPEAVERLQEYRPVPQKHKGTNKGMIAYMGKKASTCEGEIYGWLNKGEVLDTFNALLKGTHQ